MRKRTANAEATKQILRCAVYTRKSSEEGLEQDFNTLDAQRESGENFIKAHKVEGWVCIPERYDDGGYTGANLDRPAMARLVADVEARKVDCIIVYKLDRLTRSLTDFGRLMQTLEKCGVSFVSVTQLFNTKDSMGRLTLHILLSFAQFEREIISERTRDKIAAARRKGKFAGGSPILGYDIVSGPTGAKLVVNEDEARQVKVIFQTYLKYQALIPTVAEITKRGITNKKWVTKKGETKGGRPFDKCSLYRLLTNKLYLGLIVHHDEVHQGEHPYIIDRAVFEKVGAVLGRNGRTAGAVVKNKYGALLRGLLHCSCCKCSMNHTYSTKSGGGVRYRYYVCLHAQKNGWDTCPSKSVPAGEIEKFVVDQIKRVGRDPGVLEGTLRQLRQQTATALAAAQSEQKLLERELARHQSALKKTPTPLLTVQLRKTEQGLTQVRERILALQKQVINRDEVSAALASFDPLWEQLSPREQERVIQLLVQRIDYDGKAGTIAITFHPTGIRALAQEQEQEVAA
jgi:site-specific DNA recombinase